MSSDTVISVENVSKRYSLGVKKGQGSGDGFRHAVQDTLISAARRLQRGFKPRTSLPLLAEETEFWALKDVSFEIKRGDVVGVIGRNGAGKSTLLKILSRITEPTNGRIGLKGRVASLLEVGTGFHPELTGRENVYLNGAILGMSKAEVRAKFDEIISFAEVSNFLDTPVKRYSSGMYVRLAFAVAAHLEPEILIIDEILAVGDSQFQKKCLGKMQDVAAGGRTVLFVSHNIAAVQSMCTRGLVLKGGRVDYMGCVKEAVSRSFSNVNKNYSVSYEDKSDKIVAITSIEAFSDKENASVVWNVNKTLTISIDFKVNRKGLRLDCSLRLESMTAGYIQTSFSSQSGVDLCNLPIGHHCVKFDLIVPGLLPGNYQWSVWFHDPMKELYDYREAAIEMEANNDQIDFNRVGHSKNLGSVLAAAKCDLIKNIKSKII